MTHTLIRLVFLYLFIQFLTACRESAKPSSEAVREEMRSREVVHLTDARIVDRAMETGDSLIVRTLSNWSTALAKQNSGSCLPALRMVSDSLGRKNQARIRMVSFLPGSLDSLPKGKEKEILDAYLFNKENRQPIRANLQKDGQKEFIYTKALVFGSSGCSGCHQGKPGSGFSAQPGDTVGVWSIRLQKKAVVLSFVD